MNDTMVKHLQSERKKQRCYLSKVLSQHLSEQTKEFHENSQLGQPNRESNTGPPIYETNEITNNKSLLGVSETRP
jgi:hypothetical protein